MLSIKCLVFALVPWPKITEHCHNPTDAAVSTLHVHKLMKIVSKTRSAFVHAASPAAHIHNGCLTDGKSNVLFGSHLPARTYRATVIPSDDSSRHETLCPGTLSCHCNTVIATSCSFPGSWIFNGT